MIQDLREVTLDLLFEKQALQVTENYVLNVNRDWINPVPSNIYTFLASPKPHRNGDSHIQKGIYTVEISYKLHQQKSTSSVWFQISSNRCISERDQPFASASQIGTFVFGVKAECYCIR